MGEQGKQVGQDRIPPNPIELEPARLAEQTRVPPQPKPPSKPAGETTVAVIGGGIAGLTAALRLAERGYKVTVYEEKPDLGGSFAAHKHEHPPKEDRDNFAAQRPRREDTYHEHSFHMLLQWYHNFFALAADIGLKRHRDFEPRNTFKHLRKDEFPTMIDLRNPGTPGGLQANLLCGLQPIPDMFLYSYSLIDLIGQQFDPKRLLDRFTVTGFMQSRPYATEGSTALHENTLAKAFASPSYVTSASSYQSFIKYGFQHPEPLVWVLKGDSWRAFHAKLRDELVRHGCKIRILRRVTKIEFSRPYWEHSPLPGPVPPWDPSSDKRVTKITHVKVDRKAPGVMDCVPFPAQEISRLLQLTEEPMLPPPPPSMDEPAPPAVDETLKLEETDEPHYVILAVPSSQVAPLLLEPAAKDVVRKLAGDFLEIAKIPRLRGAPMASMDLRFNKRIDGIPKEHVALLDSKFDLSFIDNSQIWPGLEKTTLLNVVASSAAELAQLNAGEAAGLIIMELAKYLRFDPSKDIDWELCHYQPNVGDELFLNDVGSEMWRPTAKTHFRNLFLAGDYCQTFVDVVTLEGAVVSGLEAARQLQEQATSHEGWSASDRRARPIGIIPIETPPRETVLALKYLLAPHAMAAKWWSWADEQTRAVQRGDFSATRAAQDLTAMGAALALAPYRFAAEAWQAGWSTMFSLWSGGDVD